jgi:hypothetical protein
MRYNLRNDRTRRLWKCLMTRLKGSVVAAVLLVFAQIAGAANTSCAMAMSMTADMAQNHSDHKMVTRDIESHSSHIGDSDPSNTPAHHDDAHNTCATACDCGVSCASAATLQPASLKMLANILVATVESLHRPRQLSGFSPRHFRPPTFS